MAKFRLFAASIVGNHRSVLSTGDFMTCGKSCYCQHISVKKKNKKKTGFPLDLENLEK